MTIAPRALSNSTSRATLTKPFDQDVSGKNESTAAAAWIGGDGSTGSSNKTNKKPSSLWIMIVLACFLLPGVTAYTSSTVAEACWNLYDYDDATCGGDSSLQSCWDNSDENNFICSEFASCNVLCAGVTCTIPVLGWKLATGDCTVGADNLAAGSSCTIVVETSGYTTSGTGTYACVHSDPSTSDLAVTGCATNYYQSAGTSASDGVCTACDSTNGVLTAAVFGSSNTVCTCLNSYT
jgi:hypothetical protein